MVLELSVHSQSIVPGCGEAEHHGGRAWRSKVAHLIEAEKQRETERGNQSKM
jgi:hypothetical protein